MKIPSIAVLCREIEALLKELVPTTTTYLSSDGTWQTGARVLRDRISNELWFRLWEIHEQPDYRESVEQLVEPFMRDDSVWDVTCCMYTGFADERSDRYNVLPVVEFLSQIIILLMSRRNGSMYVADWDSREKTRQMYYLKKADELFTTMKRLLTTEAQRAALERTVKIFADRERTGMFQRICIIIAEEERLRQNLDAIFTRESSGKEKGIEILMDEQSNLSLGTGAKVPEALLRPSLEILGRKDINIASGLQYEAAGILGALKDVRCTDGVLDALEFFDSRYTNVRCNLIYALGNTRQKKAVPYLMDVLDGPDSVDVHMSTGTLCYEQPTSWEKCEAIWALGKIGADAIDSVPHLVQYVNHNDRAIRLALAWTMGMIGKAQKEKYGGVDAGIVTTLMNLLCTSDTKVFEEAAFSLRTLALPDFLHSLYLHNIKTIPVLTLKPSSAGLYELSETLYYLTSIKRPVVIAVTGDSGTGKTYFCEAIKNGFGDIKHDDIAYLMRDNPGDIRSFQRILGIRMLKELLDPQHYQDYPFAEAEDDPDEYFDHFIRKYSTKKLIILDGWMDESYFYQVIKAFYAKGYLDTIVNFRTTYSTRRQNLETREGLLESVKTCLANVEKPMLEETEFYRNGNVLVYNLDNSVQSRMSRQDIFEIFSKKKLDSWGDYLRLGDFSAHANVMKVSQETVCADSMGGSIEYGQFVIEKIRNFTPHEARFIRTLHDEEQQPNLLQSIETPNIHINRISFYTQGQIAYCGYDGSVGILSGLNDRVFYTSVERNAVSGLCVAGADLWFFDSEGDLKIISFEKNTIIDVVQKDNPVCAITSDRLSRIVTGHMDGTIKMWNTRLQKVEIMKGHGRAVTALAIDRSGRVISADKNAEIRFWDKAQNTIKVFGRFRAPATALSAYPDGRLVIGTESEPGSMSSSVDICILNADTNSCTVITLPEHGAVNTLHAYFDGRILTGIASPTSTELKGILVVIDPRDNVKQYFKLGGHKHEIRDCLDVGPRIISSGSEDERLHVLRIWGTERYVKMEREKLKLMTETTARPSYYSTLF